ncbi:MAG: hypothetical protein ABH829_04250 [archaeon]
MKLDWRSIIISALGALVVGLVVFFALQPVFKIVAPGVMAEYGAAGIFRPWSDPWMSYVFVHPFFAGLFMAVVYNFVKDSIKADTLCKKGTHFGLLVFLLGIPGMLMSYSTFLISGAMVVTWTVQAFLQTVLIGIVIAKVFK